MVRVPRTPHASTSDRHVHRPQFVHAAMERLFGNAGLVLRRRLLACQLGGLGVAEWMHGGGSRSGVVVSAMRLASFFGSEEWYTVLITVATWILHERLGCTIAVLLSLGFFIANGLKDLFCLPRPPASTVPHSKDMTNEWGFPSHHSFMSALIPWYCALFVCDAFHLSEDQCTYVYWTTALWSVAVMISRVYLCVHFVFDVIVGGTLGVLTLMLFMHVDDGLDALMAQGIRSVAGAMAVSLLVGWLYPRPNPSTNSYVETVATMGVATGFVAGHQDMRQALWHAGLPVSQHFAHMEWGVGLASTVVARLVLGIVCVLLVKTLTKMTLARLLGALLRALGVTTTAPAPALVASVHYSDAYHLPTFPATTYTGMRGLDGHALIKYVSYIPVGWMGATGVPYLFHRLSL